MGERVLSDQILRVRSKVQQWLAEEYTGVVIGVPGLSDFELAIGNTFVRVIVGPFGEASTAISFSAPVIYDVPVTEEFKAYVLDTSGTFVFGGFSYFEDEGGSNLVFQHSILGDYVDKEEFTTSLLAIGSTAADLADQLCSQFGGRRPLDD